MVDASLEMLARDNGVGIHVLGPDAGDGADPLAEAARALARDAGRAMRYLGFDDCESILVECTDGALGVSGIGDGQRVVLVSSPAIVPLGLTQRIVARATAIAEGRGL